MSITVDIHKKLGSFSLDVSFCGDDGVLALLGASGCGKSVTLKCIAGIITPDSGRIELDGHILFDSEKKINLPPQKRRVGYLFQQYALFPNMTVEQNIAAGMHGIRKENRTEKTESLIATMRLEGLNKKYPAQLSGGQQQRVALARILASAPEAILLDEPFSALDSYLKWQLETELSDLIKNFGGTVLWVSHDRDEVYRNCDKVCILDNGVSGRVETVKELFKNPDTVSAARLTGCKNFAAFMLTDEDKIYVDEWKISLNTESKPKPGQGYIGIRAHFIHPRPMPGDNAIDCVVKRVTEDTFSVVYMLMPVSAESGAAQIRLEIPKPTERNIKVGENITVGIEPKDIMLLE